MIHLIKFCVYIDIDYGHVLDAISQD